MSINSLIFDFDGTLGDSRLCSIKATKSAFQTMSLTEPSEAQIEYYMGIPIEKSFHEMSERALSENEFAQLLQSFRAFYKTYENENLKIFPGTKEMLEKFTKSGLPLFVVSSKKTDVLSRNLHTLGISDNFDEIVGSDKVSHYKPHPEGIDYIINAHKLMRAEALMIGDAIFDLQMGKAAGVQTAAVTWGSHSTADLAAEHPDFIAHSREELTDFVLSQKNQTH